MVKFFVPLKGGHIIDPGQGFDGPQDVAFANGKVVALDHSIPDAKALYVRDVTQPGFKLAGLRLPVDRQAGCRSR